MKRLSVILAVLTCAFACGAQESKPAASPAAPAAAPATNAPPQAEKAAAPADRPAVTPAVASVSPAAPAANVRNIRFQFDGIPYSAVLERFAQMVNKPLLTDTNIQGTLSYDDAQPYTYEEALDTLNVMLSMKGATLVEDGRYLRLVPFRQLPQMPLKILRGVDQSGDVRANDIVTVVLQVNNLDTKEVGEAVLAMLSNAGSVAPLSKGRGLIITDRLSNIQRIRTLLAAIDTEAVADRQMRAFTLLHSSGAVVADLINRTFGAATAPKRTQYNPNSKNLDTLPPDPNDYITAVYDDASRTLVLFGPRERLSLAEELISKFEDKEGGAGDVRIYYPQAVKVEDLAQMIRQAIPGIAAPNENASTAATKARLIPDLAQNRLIVAAPIAAQIDAIELLINRVDKPVHGNGAGVTAQGIRSQTIQMTKVFRPRTAEATNVAEILTRALTRRLPSGQTVQAANVTFDPNTQSVVVTGSPGEVQTATDIVTQLESGGSSPRPQQTRFFEVGTVAEAKRLLPLVEQIYRSQVTDSVSGQTPHAKMIADTEAGRLIVTASEEHLKRIEEIVRQLRSDTLKPQARSLHLLTLKHLRVDSAMPSINNLVNERMADKRFEDTPKPLVLADAPNNRLLVTATGDQYREIEQVVQALDLAPDKSQREMTVVPVQGKSAAELIQLTTQLMSQVVDEQPNPQLAPKLIADPSGRQIIVLAAAKDLERITNLVRRLDASAASTAARQIKSVEVFNRNATELTPLVLQLYQEQLKGLPEPQGGTATLMAEAKNNRIMVSGSDQEITRVEAIIRQLDPAESKGGKDETRVIRLKAGLASELASLVEKSLGTQAQRVKVQVDARSNSLVISGDAGAVEAASQIINQLDTRSDMQPRELRIIELKQGDANTMMSLVNNLFVEMLKDQRGPDYVPQTRIIPDAASNRLIVTGPKEELKTVNSVVEQLDQAPEAAGGARVFKLTTADASTVISVVSNAMLRFDNRNQPIRRVSISLDRESNSIVVSGPRAELQDAAAIIERLDNEGMEKGRQLKVLEVRTDDPDALALMAMKVFAAQNSGRNVANILSITPEPSGKRLIVLAPATIMPQVETVVSTLDIQSDQGNRELQVVEVHNATAAELLPVVSRIYSEQTQGRTTKPATIYPDASGTRFMVYGTREQGETIRQIVGTLESQTRAPRENKIFDLGKLAEAQRLLPLIQQLYRDRMTGNPGAGAPDAQFVSDGRTGRLIVSARTNQLPQIEQIISSLQVSELTNTPARETRTFEVGNSADVLRLLPIVQQLYKDQWKDRSETDPADAQIVGDAKTGRVIVTGKPEHIRQIEAILKQLSDGATKADTRDTRVFDLTTANAMEIATTVRTLYLEQAKTRLGNIQPDTLIMPDATANRLILVGETTELEAVEELIKKLDKVGTQSASVRVFKLKSAEPNQVSQILSTALVRFDAYGRQQRRVSIVADPQSRTLIATGDPKELQGLSVIIEQLDSAGVKPERKMKVVQLTSGRSYEVAAKLRQLYNDQIKSKPDLGTMEILILEEAPSNQLILAGNEEQLALLDTILTELQNAQANQPPRETRIIEIGQTEEMQRLMPMVQQLYQERWRHKAAGDPADAQILSDLKNARLIVTGKTNHLAEIETILAQLRGDKTTPEPRDSRIFDLTTANASELSTTVRTLYMDQAKTRPGAQPQDTLILPDVSANRLIVSGQTNELDAVEEIIKKLDKVSAQSGTVRVFKLKYADPAKVMEILGNTLTSYDSYGRMRRRVGVTLDAKTRSIIVAGDPKELQALQNAAVIIEQLDNALGMQAERKIKILSLKQAKVGELMPKIRQLYNDQLAGKPELAATEVLMLEETPSNQLILAGSDKQLELVEEIATQLESSTMALEARETRVYELTTSAAPELANTLQSLYQEVIKTHPTSFANRATILPDINANRLIISATTNDLQIIDDIIQKLDKVTSQSGTVRVFKLKYADPAKVMEILGNALTSYDSYGRPRRRVGVTLDSKTRTIIVAGDPKELQTLQNAAVIIEQLDNALGQQAERKIKVITLKQAKVAELVPKVRQLYNDQLAGRPELATTEVLMLEDALSNQLILAGNDKQLELVEQITSQLETSAMAQETRETRVYELTSSTAPELVATVQSLYQEAIKTQPTSFANRATILPDVNANRLIVSATTNDLQIIDDIIQKLDKVTSQSGSVRVFKLKYAEPAKVMEILSNALTSYDSYGRPRRRVGVTLDSKTRTIIVAGDPKELQTLQNAAVIIEQLDNALGLQAERKIKVITLKQAKVAELMPKVRQLYNDQIAGKPELATTEVLMLEDAPSNQLILAGNDNQLELVEQITSQLETSAMAQEPRDTRVYELTSTSAPELATTVMSLYQEAIKSHPTSLANRALVLPDVTANRLIVSATTNDLAVIDEIIQKLDKTETQAGRTRVFKLKSAEAQQVATILSSTLVQLNTYGRSIPRVSVGTDIQNNLLIVSGAPQDLQSAAVIIEQMDTMLAKEPRQLRVVVLKTGLATEVATRVQTLYKDQLKGQVKLGPADGMVLGDDLTSRLIMTASESHMKILEEIVSKLQEVGDGSGRQVRVVHLQRNSATSVAAMIAQLFARQVNSEDPSQRLTVTASGDDRVIIVDAAGETLAKVEEMIKSLDGDEAKGAVQVRTYQVPDGNAFELAGTLSRLFAQRSGPQNFGQGGGGLAPRFEGDASANILMVAATTNQFAQIESLIEELKKNVRVANEIRTFRMRHSDPAQVAEVLETMLTENDNSPAGRQRERRTQWRPGIGLVPIPDTKTVRIAPAPLLNSVIVQGPPEKLMVAEKLIQSLDDKEAFGNIEVRTYQVPQGNAAELAPTLIRLFAQRGQTERGQFERGQPRGVGSDPRFEADSAGNVLMVAATKEQFIVIDKLIDELKKNAEVSNEIRTFKLQNGDPNQVAEVLESMLAEGEAQRTQRRFRRMQQEGGEGPRFGGLGQASGGMVRVSPAPSLSAVIVQGPPPKLLLAEKLIQTLDRAEIEGKSVIQTVHLKKAHAEDLALAVSKTLTNRWAPGKAQRISVTPVAGPNSLLLNGPSETVQEVMQIIHELDQESESDEIKVHIYKLENGNAKELSNLIEDLLQGVTRTQMRLRPTGRNIFATVSVDDRSNSLIISGTTAHFKVVEQMLQTLDKVPERSERDVHFVWLRNAKALDVSSKIEAVFTGRPEGDRPVIEADLYNNSITIIGKRADVLQAEGLIQRLDESSRDTSLQVRLRPLDRIPVEQMAQMLQNIYPQMSAGKIRIVEKLQPPPKQEKPSAMTMPQGTNPAAPAAITAAGAKDEAMPEVVIAIDKNANSLILSGPTHELDQIDNIITDLSFSYVSSDAEFKVFPLKEADPVIVARTLTDLFKPDQIQLQHQQQMFQQQQPPIPGQMRTIIPAPKITVVAEPRTRSVIVRAKPTDFTLLETLVKQLDVAGLSSQLEFRVVKLTNAPPEKVIPLVQQMVAQLNVVRPGEPLTVTADPRSRGLLVFARDSVLNQVERMIHTLDTPSEYSEAEVLVVSLKKANANQLAAVMQGMLKPGAAGELTSEARELQEQIRRLKIQNDQGQAVLLDLTKPIKIMADPVTGGQGGGNRLVLSSTPDNLKALAAVVEMMDSAPILEGVNVRLVHLEHADAAAVAQTLSIIFAQGQRLAIGPGGRAEPEGTQGKALVQPLNVAPDPRSNCLILSGHKESLDLAIKIVDDLDRKVERFTTEVKLFRLKHASAMRLAPLLQSVFAEGPAVPGTEGLSTQVTRLQAVLENEKPQVAEVPKTRSALVIQPDDTSNILIVSARTDTLPLIEAVITQLDIPSASGLDIIRIYPLAHSDAVTIQKLITDLYTGPRAAQLRTEDKPNVTIDERTQALIVSGNSKAFGIIEGLLAKLDRELPLELRDVRILPLEHADALEIAATIQRLLDARVTQKSSLSKVQADAMRMLVVGEPRSNSLLIAGSKDGYELVESLAQELDNAPAALSGRIRLVPLEFADARFLSTALNNLFTQRYSMAKSPETQRNRPIIVPDARANAILIAASVDDNQTIDDLVSKLDRKLEDPSMVLTVVPLRHNDAGRIGPTLENIFAARLRSRTVQGQPPSPQDMVEIQTDSLNNALVVSASKENVELLRGLLEKIDVEPVATDGLVQAFTLEYADAQRVANMLRSLVDQGLYRPGMPAVSRGQGNSRREAMAITVDPRSNTLIVSASPENLLVIKELIKQVDSKDFTEMGNVRMYNLKHAKASTLASVLLQFFRSKRAAEMSGLNAAERSIPVTVIPDDRTNTLLVTGGKESFDAVERVIQQLDGEDIMARLNFRVFPLKQATAAKLQDTLQRLFANRPSRIQGEPPEPITVVADAWVNALIVGASVDDMGMVASIIERLDSEQTQLGVTVQVISLTKADARRVAQTLQSLYREGTSGTSLPILVSADERLNAVVISAGESDVKRIMDLVKKLDTDQVGRVSEIRVFGLRFARADSMATILNTSLNSRPTPLSEQNPNSQSLLQFITRTQDGKELVTSALKEAVLITPDARMNSLIVSAPLDYMGLLEQIIEKLDTGSPQEAKIKVFPLVNADARQMAELLVGIFRLQPATAPGSQRSIQYTLVKSNIDPNAMPEELGASTFETEEQLASATIGTVEQAALTVTVDPRTNSLLVGGTERYIELVSHIIQELDSSEAQERRTRVCRLKNAQAGDVQLAVRSFLDQERQRVQQVLGQDAVGTAQRMLEREVAIVAEPTSNTLMISANPRYFDQMMELVEQLDQPMDQVLIQVLLAEVSLDDSTELGIEWSYEVSKGNALFKGGTDLGVAKDFITSGGGYGAVLTSGDYSFLVRALQNSGRLEVLSRPQILTSDNKAATINVGQRVPVITGSSVTPQGGSTASINYENVGVNLTVTPRIGAEGLVQMEIGTTNSALSSSAVEVPSGAENILRVPIINERRATTSVSVQSGQSIIIGGLISTTDDTRTKKVPFLGDIPGLGVFFRKKSKLAERKELLILLTPQVLRQSQEIAIISDVKTFTREQLDRSRIKDKMKMDEYRKILLDPLFPNQNTEPVAPSGNPSEKPEKPEKKQS